MSAKITVKKNLIIFHRPGEWIAIYTKIMQEFGRGMAVRTRLQRELGFTYRHHRGLEPNEEPGANHQPGGHADVPADTLVAAHAHDHEPCQSGGKEHDRDPPDVLQRRRPAPIADFVPDASIVESLERGLRMPSIPTDDGPDADTESD